MDDYKIRCIHEYFELIERINRLEKMLLLNKIDALDFELNCPVELLQRQFMAMMTYRDCLLERIKIEMPNIAIALDDDLEMRESRLVV